MHLPAAIPSPSQSVWNLGPLPLRAYALAILAGIVAALWITQRRMAERGGPAERVVDIAFWAVPFGIVGGRVYHVVSSPQAYFGEGGDPWRAFAIWEGGLGIWGAIALGAVGAWIGCRRHNVRFASFADVVAPGLLVAQAIGRLGNWFNQELFGGPTQLPWGLEIDPAHRPPQYAGFETFHPTFLYESLGNLIVVPIGDSLLYVQPLYLVSDQTQLPQLKRVIVFYQAKSGSGEEDGADQLVVMAPTLADALAEAFGEAPAIGPPGTGGGTEGPTTGAGDGAEPGAEPGAGGLDGGVQQLIEQANERFQAAQAAQQGGDWAEYGRQIELLRQTLRQLQQLQ